MSALGSSSIISNQCGKKVETKSQNTLGLIPTFVEVTREKTASLPSPSSF